MIFIQLLKNNMITYQHNENFFKKLIFAKKIMPTSIAQNDAKLFLSCLLSFPKIDKEGTSL